MKETKKNTWQGFLALFGSMLLYAFSGVVVVGLSVAFGNVGQVTFRALAALVLVLFWLVVTGFRYKLNHKNHYDLKWLIVDVVCRPIFNICFVYAALSIGPTAALFYLFASKVIFGGVIKLLIGNKKKLLWYDYLSYTVVIVGLFVFSYPVSFVNTAIYIAMTSGFFEAVKSEAMGKLSVKNEDKPVVALYEFFSLAVITALIVMFVGQSFVVADMTLNIWFVLALSAVTAVGSLFLELTGFAKFDADLGNAILASEMGFAGWINYLVLGTEMTGLQMLGAGMLVVSLVFVAIASYLRSKK